MFARDLFGRISRPSLNRKNKYPANIIHVPRQLTRPKLTANINPREHGFVSKLQTLIPANISVFTVIFSIVVNQYHEYSQELYIKLIC